jgi:drug/metabolite transporter superfamily protein YnfA
MTCSFQNRTGFFLTESVVWVPMVRKNDPKIWDCNFSQKCYCFFHVHTAVLLLSINNQQWPVASDEQ